MSALKVFGRQKSEGKPAKSATTQLKAAVSMSSHISSPHITEKATDLASKNQYVFIVSRQANKSEIARAVGKMYNVNVKGVRIVNVHAKKMRLGRIQGVKTGYKKAMVKLAEGQKIDILPT
ncbi:MAG TPA: 50S ribosomal protein L23 [Candidatus Paceibacterota bacterium]